MPPTITAIRTIRASYENLSGCGNSLDISEPRRSCSSSPTALRYWVREMHVDGFRFDLASTLGRDRGGLRPAREPSSRTLAHQDPVLQSASSSSPSPGTSGSDGYQLGNYPLALVGMERPATATACGPSGMARPTGGVSEVASRLAGSSGHLRATAGRGPRASINYITRPRRLLPRADLVSYERKHNEANGEANRDGTDDDRSWNCGHEGPTDDGAVLALRRRQKRNLLATLMLSSGVPMLLAGDELGRTQQGNNNAYCQDGELSWLDWDGADGELLDFVRRLVRLRREHPVFHGRGWFRGRVGQHDDVHDVAWFQPDGGSMEDEHWTEDPTAALGVFWNGAAIPGAAEGEEPLVDRSYFLMLNATPEGVAFRLPEAAYGASWTEVFDTAGAAWGTEDGQPLAAGAERELEARSLVLFERLERA